MARIEDYLSRQYEDTPGERIGIAGFTLFAKVEEKTTHTATAPATPVEDGSFVNDHIILNPVRLNIQGNVSTVYVEPNPVIRDLKRTQQNVGVVTQYAPERTASQVQGVNSLINDLADSIRKADAIIDTGEQVVKFFGNQDPSGKTNQDLFIDAMDSLYYGKQLFSVDTEYRRFNNMVMTSMEVTRDNRSEAVTFSIQIEQFRFASVAFAELASAPNPAVGLNGQTDPESAKGAQEGEPVDKSLLSTLVGLGG